VDPGPEFPVSNLQWGFNPASKRTADDCRGMTNTFGAFQTYYINTLLPESSPSNISWIGSIQTFTMMFVGVLSGRLLDAGYLRPQLCAGIFLEVLGLIMTSISTKYWQVLVSQGVCVGLGAGLLYLPGVAVPAQYFSSKVMLATGIVATGSSMGTSSISLSLTQDTRRFRAKS
jgi:MFS family permease